jgi:amino acid adenylation domain-containing protein
VAAWWTAAARPTPVASTPDDVAYVMYTSGSTGTPKGVRIPHRGIVRLVIDPTYVTLGPAETVLHAAPIAFDASTFEIWGALLTGARLVLAPPAPTLADLATTIARHHVTTLWLTASLFHLMVDEHLPALRGVRQLLAGGDVLSPPHVARAVAALGAGAVINGYGPTENTTFTCCHAITAADAQGAIPIGRPIAGTTVYVLDAAQRPVPVGVPGELYTGGAGLARDYLGAPTLTAARFVPNPFGPGRLYRTGDRVRWRGDGTLAFLGRADTQIKLRGFRVEPAEIEAALHAHERVKTAVVQPWRDADTLRLVAYYAGDADRDELRAYLASRLPSYLVPHAFVRLDALPLTPNGKVDRRALPAPEAAGPRLNQDAVTRPTTATETTLTRIWTEVLRVEAAGIHENFFDLGGDSIVALQIVARARAAGLSITQALVFMHQTIADLARAIDAGPAAVAAAVDAPSAVSTALAPIQEWFFSRRSPKPGEFCQWVLLDVPSHVSPATIEHALALLVARHDVFRLRFEEHDGAWRPRFADDAARVPLENLDDTAIDIERELTRLRATIDLGRGPFIRACWIGGVSPRLLIVAHHVAVDAVSWQVVARELADLCDQLHHGRTPVLPPTTVSYAEWMERARETSQARGSVRATANAGTFANARVITRSLAADRVRSLSMRARACGAGLDDLLLAALATALARWSGNLRQTIDVERHGRDAVASLDLSASVGWFTTIAPVVIDVPTGGGLHALLSTTPRAATDSAADVSFNYLGRVDDIARDGGWRFSDGGLTASPDHPRSHRIAFWASIRDGALEWTLEHAASIDAPESMARLADAFAATLASLDDDNRDTAIEALLPVNATQEGILFHAALSSDPSVYVTQVRVDFDGTLPEDAVRLAWTDVTARHAALRTRFVRGADQVHRAEILRVFAIPLESIDRRDDTDAGRWFDAYMTADRARGFDLTAAPPWRLAVVALPGGQSSWLWTSHHVLLDGWSVATVLRDVADRIEQRLSGEAAAVDIAAVPSVPDRSPSAEAESFWRSELTHWSSSTGLPLERATGTPSTICGPVRRLLQPALCDAVRVFARTHRLTLHTVLQGAWSLLLLRCFDRGDVVFGEAVSGRSDGDDTRADAVGLYIRTVPVRVDAGDEETVAAWLGRLQRRHIERERHANTPLHRIHEAGGVRGVSLFDTLFVVENYPVDAAVRRAFGPVAVRAIDVVERPHYGLTVSAAADAAQMTFTAYHDAARLSDRGVDELLDRYVCVLTGLVADGEARLGALGLYGADEAGRVANARNQTARAFPTDRTLLDLFEAQVARTPDAPAVVFDASTISYRELDERANALGHTLQQRGIGTDSLVGVSIDRSLELVVALYGVLKAGGAYVAIDPAYPAERRAFMTRDAALDIVLDAPSVARVGRSAVAPEQRVTPDHLVYLLYTSGSTGAPKGALNTHRGIVNRLLWMQEAFRLTASDVVLQKTPFSFDVSVWEFFWPLITGATLVVSRPGAHLDRESLLDAIARHGVTTMHFVPSMLRVFLDAPDLARTLSLRRVVVSGEALPGDLVDRFHERIGCELHNLYGPTEAAVDVTWWPSPKRRGATVSIGKPIANTQVHVLDRAGRLLPPGAPGELHIGGVQVGRGYWNRPALTAERFVPSPFAPGRLYRTGDVVRLLDDGNLEYLGRADDQVKIRGVRVELGEIEWALRELDDVADAVVTAIDRDDDRVLVSYCVGRRGDVSADTLRAHLRTRLPEAFVPSFFVPLAAIPRLPNGKVDRRALPAPSVAARVNPSTPPRLTGAEAAIAAIWREVLGVTAVPTDRNFFDLGGHSLSMMRVHGLLQARHGSRATLVDLFAHPTVASLARFLGGEAVAAAAPSLRPAPASDPIAIVGMAGRLPGASGIDEFWSHLVEGRESITFFSDEELRRAGVADDQLRHPAYVRAHGTIADPYGFDAAFFDISPREAERLDPQQRVFLEVVWEALERAACDPARTSHAIGVFAGAGVNTYALDYLRRHSVASEDEFALLVAGDKDFLATRVSYKLDLRGPSIGVQTACSTSLVAVHLACESLRRCECGVAVAGGVTIRVPHHAGYIAQDGMIFSPDGHCRAFDASAAGVVAGSGAAVVVLKRLSDALADGDHIHAVIRGTAINNDGSAKVGYTAPSVEGQAAVIAAALAHADVDPATIGYVEAHGTGTPVGDPIEVAALTRAWNPRSGDRRRCALGSLKTNVGHLDAAAGVAGLIKAALAVEHGVVPPTLHFDTPNPALDLDATPFFIATHASAWPLPGVRRAAVSSFGIGGTNAHAILEQSPDRPVATERPAPYTMVLSARTPSALRHAASQLADALDARRDLSLTDVEPTLLSGRRRFPYRRAIVCDDRTQAIAALRDVDARTIVHDATDGRPVVFVFSGYGAQYPGMARGLYASDAEFRNDVDRCVELLRPQLPEDLRRVMFDADAATLRRPLWAQPALFVIEYALARLWRRRGITPIASFGHSVGEYAAACDAGVFAMEEALALVADRGRLIDSTAPGAMLAVAAAADDLAGRLPAAVSIAVVTSPEHVVVAGPVDAIDAFERELAAADIDARRVAVDRAMHSALMDPAVAPLRDRVSRMRLSAPDMPIVSCTTARRLSAGEATDTEYWAHHLRAPVQLSDALGLLLREHPNACVLEVGPGRTVAGPVLRHAARQTSHRVCTSLRAPGETLDDGRFVANTVAELWTSGVCVDTRPDRVSRRVVLPTYPFEHHEYRLDAVAQPAVAQSAVHPTGSLTIPTWTRSVKPRATVDASSALVLAEPGAIGDAIASELARRGLRVSVVRPDDRNTASEYGAMLDAVGGGPDIVVHACCPARIERVLLLSQAVAERADACRLAVITMGAHRVTGDEALDPMQATVIGPVRVLPQEHDRGRARQIDLATDAHDPGLAADIVDELLSDAGDTLVAYRHGLRWLRAFAPVDPNAGETSLRDGGVYVVAGGTGGVGLELAAAIAEGCSRPHLVLLSRTASPARTAPAVARLEALGASVTVDRVDISDADATRAALRRVARSIGPLRGIVHAAGMPGGGTLVRRTPESLTAEFAAKVNGTQVMYDLCREHEADFLVLCSSTSALTGGFGSVGYTAANAFQDAFAEACGVRRDGPRVVAVNWHRWQGLGMAVAVERLHESVTGRHLTDGLSADEGRRAFRRMLACHGVSRVVVYPGDVALLERETRTAARVEMAATTDAPQHERPPLDTVYRAPATPTEHAIASLWSEILGIERIGCDDPFLALGGDSLLGTRLMARIRRDLAVALPVRTIYDLPTVTLLAARVDAVRWAQNGLASNAGAATEAGVL